MLRDMILLQIEKTNLCERNNMLYKRQTCAPSMKIKGIVLSRVM